MANDWLSKTLNVSDGALSSTSMRYHELAIVRWLNKVFTLRWGVPVPVVICSPTDAFSLFSKLWAEDKNPFQYLLAVKDENGVPLYQPYPQPVRYPLISVYRKGWKYRQYQNFSIHRMRHINWPTVSDAAQLHSAGTHQQGTTLTLCDLGNVTTSRFPMAFDYRFQIDHFCNRPDTQAFFSSQLFREFWRTGGPVLQTWSVVKYPGFGDKLIRIYIEGDIDSLTPDEPEEGKNVEFRTSFTVVMEGYDIDVDYKIYPALWDLILRVGTAPPEAINAAFDFTGTSHLREEPKNPEVDYRKTIAIMPPDGTCSTSLRNNRLAQDDEIILTSLIVTFPGVTDPPGYPPPTGVEHFGGGTLVTGTVVIQTAYGTDYSGLSGAFFSGSYIDTSGSGSIIPTGTNFDVAFNHGAFLVGSMDLFIRIEQVGQPQAFTIGTYFPVIVSAGTFPEGGTMASAFTIGTYFDTIVNVDYGTDHLTMLTAFGTGTYFNATVDAGSYFESGTVAQAFTTGSYIAMIIDAGTRFEGAGHSSAFLIGTYS